MSTQTQPTRPWLCSDRLVDAYLARAQDGDDLRVLKTVRAIESLIVNAGIIAMTSLALYFGEANPYVVLAAIVTLGLLNGVLAADYRALGRALAELTDAPSSGNDETTTDETSDTGSQNDQGN